METAPSKTKVLPENAYTPLGEGETYVPVVPAGKILPEITLRSVLFGVGMAVLFTFAAVYLGLKTGNVIETAIPIAILAVFFGRMYARRNTILENVIVQSVGAASGVVVAGAIFTIPALYINQLSPKFWHTFLAASLGGFLGIVLLIPLRRYFVREQHGMLPFPEATATTEILAAGEQAGGSGGRILMIATAVGAAYDFCIETFHMWTSHLNSTHLLGALGARLAGLRMVFKLDALAALFGLGYIIGIRYAAIIAGGSVLSMLVMVPLVYHFGSGLDFVVPPAKIPISAMSAELIFGTYVRPIGIGAIAMAGFIGIAKMSRIIVGSFSLGFKGLLGSKKTPEEAGPSKTQGGAGSSKTPDGDKSERTDLDIAPRNVLVIQFLALAALFFIFWIFSGQLKVAVVGMLVAFVLSFLFTPVAARAIAIVGVNPVSGMTLITLIIACLILVQVGLSGGSGQMIALVIGCAVCTALSTSGAFVSDLKIGYWLGATPRNQERWKFLGIVVAAVTVGLAIWLLDNSYGFMIMQEGQRVANPDLPAPQGHLMAAVAKSVMSKEYIPYLLYGLGALISVLLEMAKVPPLAFALGMYLPIQINMAVLAGGTAAWIVGRTGKTEEVKAARRNQGILIASGMMAGAALIGIVSAVLRLKELDFPVRFLSVGVSYAKEAGRWVGHHASWWDGAGQYISLLMFVLLGVFAYLLARYGANVELKAKKTAEPPPEDQNPEEKKS